jgi:hypothetical protein
MNEAEYKCPFCGKKFEYRTQRSYTTFGQFLDFKPYGAAKIPTPVPKCPKCNLVFFKELFTKGDINKLKKKFVNNNIFQLEPGMPNYYYLAKEFELLDKEIDKIIYYYHSAIWENDGVFEKIANIIIQYFERINDKDKNYYIYKLIKIDFLRRLEQFIPAIELIESLKNDTNFPNDNFWKLLDYQLKLIEEKNIREHKMPD